MASRSHRRRRLKSRPSPPYPRSQPREPEGPTMAERRRAGRLVVPPAEAPADKMLLERSAIEELSHHADPWRVLRILSEFVEGFDALDGVGPAVTGFGAASRRPGATCDAL